MFALYFYVEHNCVFQVETKWKDLTKKFRDPRKLFFRTRYADTFIVNVTKNYLDNQYNSRRRHILQTSRQKLAEATTRGNLQSYSLLSVAMESMPAETI